MAAEASRELDLALRAPVDRAGAADQLCLPVSEPSKRVLEGQAGEKKPAGIGRPPGSANRFTRDLARLVTQKLGRHPLEEVLRLYQMPNEALCLAFSCDHVTELRTRLLFKLVEATTPKMPVSLDVTKTETVRFILGDLGRMAEEAENDDDVVLDLAASEFKGLAAS